MKTTLFLLLALTVTALAAEPPAILNHQGRIVSGGVNFDGTGHFKFALLNTDGTQTFWTNSPDASPADGEPDAAVQHSVVKGHYALGLGDTALVNMVELDSAVFTANDDVHLRIWFSADGVTFEQLAPDQPITSVAYAMSAGRADGVAEGAVTEAMIADGAITSIKLQPTFQSNQQTQLGQLDLSTLESGMIDFTTSFERAFDSTPEITLSDGSTNSVSDNGFTASLPFAPVVADGDAPMQESSLALVQGRPAIAYRDPDLQDLKYVYALDARGAEWVSPITVDSAGAVGGHASLVVVGGLPAIAYSDSTPNFDLKFVLASNASGSSWSDPITVLSDDSVGGYCSLAVIDGKPAIAFRNGTTKELLYITATDAAGSSWSAPVIVESTGNPVEISLAEVNGVPAVSYRGADIGSNNPLKFAYASDATGASWTRVTVDETMSVSADTSLAVVAGVPAISYYDTTNDVLRYAYGNDAQGTSWTSGITVDSSPFVGDDSSLAVAGGVPVISYRDDTNNDLKLAYGNDAQGMTWTAVTGDSANNTGTDTSIAALSNGIGISYADISDTALNFAFIPLPSWSAATGTVHDLVAAGVKPGSVTGDSLAAESVTAEKLGAGSISADKLATASIATEKLASRSVTSDKLALQSVTSAILASGSVTADKLALGGTAGQVLSSTGGATEWIEFDHSGLSGLGDDDHPQYLLGDGSEDFLGDLRVVGQIGAGSSSFIPKAQLEIRGRAIFGDVFTSSTTTASNMLNLLAGISSDGHANGISFFENSGGFGMALGYDGTGSGAENRLHIYSDLTSTPVAQFTFEHGGNFGIGVADPTVPLHVTGEARIEGDLTVASPGVLMVDEAAISWNNSEDALAIDRALVISGGSPGGTSVHGELDDFDVLIEDDLEVHGKVYADGGLEVGTGSTSNSARIDFTSTEFLRWSASADRFEFSDDLAVNGTVSQSSDRSRKDNITPVDPDEILEKLADVPISRWNYIGDAGQTPHIGPMSQDFHAAFGVGPDDRYIAMIDADGVALAAIKGLYEKVKSESEAKSRRIEELEQRLERLERSFTDIDWE